MGREITKLDSPIDAMYLIHKALRAEAARVEGAIDQIGEGGNLQPIQEAFSHWAMVLGYHAEVEDKYMTALLPDSLPARDNEATHRGLGEMLENVQADLNEAIEQAVGSPRTKRHLYGKVVALRIAQDDHLEEEEEFVLPGIRQRIGEEQQLEMARRLLVDREAPDTRWILDWVARDLTPSERELLAGLVAHFKEAPPGAR